MVFTFAGTVAQFINDDWQIVERLVDFYHIQDKEHEGEWAAKAFVRSIKERGSANKICVSLLVLCPCVLTSTPTS